MNIFTKTLIAGAIAAVALTGCSAAVNGDNPSPSANQSVDAKSQKELATKFVSEYYAGWFKAGDKDSYQELQDKVTEIVGEDDGTIPSNDPVEFFDALPEEKQKELAKVTAEMSDNAKFYDTTGMSDSEAAVLHIMVASLSELMSVGGAVEIESNPDKIEVKDNVAIVPFSALSVTFSSFEPPKTTTKEMKDEEGFPLKLVFKNNVWKVDGKDFLKTIMTPDTTQTDNENTQ